MHHSKNLIIRGLFLTALIFVFPLFLSAQGNCKVLTAALNTSYDGACKKGLAEGRGNAQGSDSYAGDFKKGLPDGDGKYIWKNGNTYEGQWLKGKMHGNGTYSYKRPGKTDSIVTGTWTENNFHSANSQPYIIHLKSASVSEVELKRKTSDVNNVTLNLTSTTAGGTFSKAPDGVNDANWQPIPPPKITDLTVVKGFYGLQEKDKENTRATRTILRQVEFPLRLKIEMADQNLDLEILEAGDWAVYIRLNNNYNAELNVIPTSE